MKSKKRYYLPNTRAAFCTFPLLLLIGLFTLLISNVRHADAACGFPANVANEVAFNEAIACYNAQTDPGDYTIRLTERITLTEPTTPISRTTSSVALIIDGNGQTINGQHAYRPLTMWRFNDLTVNNLTIINGRAHHDPQWGERGGAILFEFGNLTVNDSTFINNRALNQYARGGAIYVDQGTLNINNSVFRNNFSNEGGAVFSLVGRTIIENSVFMDNAAHRGGAIGFIGGGRMLQTLTVRNSTVFRNTAGVDGGGLYITDAIVDVENTLFDENTSRNTGGAINSRGFSYVNVTQSWLRNNEAGGSAGAIYNSGHMTVTQTTLNGNRAEGGNAGAIKTTHISATLTIANSTISENIARIGDGAGLVSEDNTTTRLFNVTLYANHSMNGPVGGIAATSGSLTIHNSILSSNDQQSCGIGPNVVINISHSRASDATCGVPVGDNILLSLDDNDSLITAGSAVGGFSAETITSHAVVANSSGNSAACATSPVNGIDQRGFARPDGAQCEIGAVEGIFFCPAFPLDVVDFAGLNAALGCYKQSVNNGIHVINILADILPVSLFEIENGRTGAELHINGNGSVIFSTLNQRMFEIKPNARVMMNELAFQIPLILGVEGGGIHNRGTLTVNRSTFRDGLNKLGGAIYNEGVLVVNNSTFSENRAHEEGGAIYNAQFGRLDVNNSTFYHNHLTGDVGFSDGIYNKGFLNMRNTIIQNSDHLISGCVNIPPGETGEIINNILSPRSIACTLNGGGHNNFLYTDASLAPLQKNRGTTFTHPLKSKSPAVNAGDTTVCATIGSKDQRGIYRLGDGNCDIGAVEAADCDSPSPWYVNSLSELEYRIECFNAKVTGTYRIEFQNDIFAEVPPAYNNSNKHIRVNPNMLTVIHNEETGAELHIDGNGYALDGQNQLRVLDIRAGNVTISDLTIQNGKVDLQRPYIYPPDVPTWQTEGGGILNNGTLTLIDSTIRDNASLTDVEGQRDKHGGGIYNRGTLTIQSSTLYGNQTDGNGNGVYNSGVLSVNNSTLSGHTGFRSGIYSNGTLTLQNSTFSATPLVNRGVLRMYNSILANSNTDCVNHGSILANSHMLIEDGSCNPAISSDPKLYPLNDNGGSTLTHQLFPDSIAIDNGDNTFCANVDQRGFPRPANGDSQGEAECDIGAYEQHREPNLSVSMERSNASPTHYEPVKYIVTISNTGGIAMDVLLEDTVARELGIIIHSSPKLIDPPGLLGFATESIVARQFDVPEDSTVVLSYDVLPMATSATLNSTLNLYDDGDIVASTEASFVIANPCATVTFPAVVSIALELNRAIACYNHAAVDSGTHDITLANDINLLYKTIAIDNPNTGVDLHIHGNNHTLNGNQYHSVLRVTDETDVTIDSITIQNGFGRDNDDVLACGDCGGGILTLGDVTLNDSTITHNHQGGIYNGGDLTIHNSTISHNVTGGAFDAGGIDSRFGVLTLRNSTVSHNSGTGIWGGNLVIDNSTISSNGAYGVYGSDDFDLHNSILANNSFADCIGGSADSQFINNLIEVQSVDDPCEFGANDLIGVDPLLGLLQDNGGSTHTHELLGGSPAVNAGDPATCLATDQRGVDRPQGEFCDIGAIESLSKVGITKSVDNSAPFFGETVTYTVVISNAHGLTVTQAAVTDHLAAGLNFVPNSTTLTPITVGTVGDAPQLVTDLTLGGGETVTITYQTLVVAASEQPVTNTVSISETQMSATVSATATIQVDDSFQLIEVDVDTVAELNQAIAAFNAQTIPTEYKINLISDIGLTVPTTMIGNATDAATLTIVGNGYVLDGMAAQRGLSIAADTDVFVDALMIQNGSAEQGGGIYNLGNLSLTNSTVSGNSATNDGGGLYNAGDLTLTNSTVSGNSAISDGGGLYNAGDLALTNSTVSGNSAEQGGGIFSSTPFTINNSTISNNTATDGGGLFTSAQLNVYHALIVNNPTGGDCNRGDLTNSLRYNMDSDGSCGLGQPQDRPNTTLTLDPLADNGGPTLTHALPPGNPAINIGSCTLPTDQRGLPRDSRCDIGAYEHQKIIVVDTLLDEQDGSCHYNDDCSLRDALALIHRGDTIRFAPELSGGTITLSATLGTLEVDWDVTIQGNVPLTISGGNAVRVLMINKDNGFVDLTLDRLTIEAGFADIVGFAGEGGAIYNDLGNLTLLNTTLRNNQASRYGGAIYNNGGTVTLISSTLVGNATTNSSLNDGGGIYSAKWLNFTPVLNIENSTFSGNSSGGNGGAIYNEGSATANNSTWYENTHGLGKDGGAFYNTASITISNSIIAESSCHSGYTSGGHNRYTEVNCGSIVSSDQRLFDFEMEALADNGGSTWTHAPAVEHQSQIVDQGNPATCLATDQRGVVRPQGAACDVGAHEVATPTLSISKSVDDPTPSFDQTLTYTVVITNHGDPATDIVVTDRLPVGLTFVDGSTTASAGTTGNAPQLVRDLTMRFGTLVTITYQAIAVAPGETLTNVVTATSPSLAVPATAMVSVLYDPCDMTLIPSADVDSTATLNHAITCYNQISDTGTYTINFVADITLTAITAVIDNPIDGVELVIDGHGYALDGNHANRGFAIQRDSDVTINNLTFQNGLATNGGGIVNVGTLTINDSTFDNNTTTNDASGGGGIRNVGTLTVNRSTFSNNRASGYGGAIYNDGGTATINDSTLDNNNGILQGGGIDNTATMQISNSTFHANETTGAGGGLYNRGASVLTIDNSTFSENNAVDVGGGIRSTGTLHLRNSMIANHDNGDCVGVLTTNVNNLIEDANHACGIGHGDGNSIVGVDPQLDSLKDNGGATQTLALLAGSPAIDAGDNATCLATDQRGNVRPQDGNADAILTCDIGAVEISFTCPAFPINVNSTGQLNLALDCYNTRTDPATYTIHFMSDIVLDAATTVINNPIDDVALVIDGHNYTLDGDYAYRGFAIQRNSDVTISNLTVQNGRATNGGGIVNVGTLVVNDSIFDNNEATNIALGGGGIRNVGSLTVNRSTFSHNSAERGASIVNNGTTMVDASTFSNNVAIDRGGGIYNIDGAVTVNSSTFISNSALYGGGIYNFADTLTVDNSTFNRNSATLSGGGIYNTDRTVINHSTFVNNSATSGGGGVSNPSGTTTLNNSLLADNTGGDCSSNAITSNNNLIKDGSCRATLTDDPKLGSLADNGGPTHTLLPAADSPVIDAGGACGLATDQRGQLRDAQCDIGAVELQSADPQLVTQSNIPADVEVTFESASTELTWTGDVNPGTITVTKKVDEDADEDRVALLWTVDADEEENLNVTLTFCYDQSDLSETLAAAEANLIIFHRHTPDDPYEQLATTVDTEANCVTAEVVQFSDFLVGLSAPTAVTLEYLTATRNENGSVTLNWETSQEVDHAGFNLYRREVDSRSAWALVNDQLIASYGLQSQGAAYQFTDSSVPTGSWEYLLEDVETDGDTYQHTAVVATVTINSPTAVRLAHSETTAFGTSTLTRILPLLMIAVLWIMTVVLWRKMRRRS